MKTHFPSWKQCCISFSCHLHPLHQFRIACRNKICRVDLDKNLTTISSTANIARSQMVCSRVSQVSSFRGSQARTICKGERTLKFMFQKEQKNFKTDNILYLQDLSKCINMSPRMDWPRQIKMILILHGLEPCCLPILQIDLQLKGSSGSGQSRGKIMEILTGYVYTHINC